VGRIGGVSSYGEPTSFLQAADGIDVISSDGDRVGALVHVLADEESDIFDGVIVDTRSGPGGHRFVDAPEVGGFYDRAVVLTISTSEIDDLPEPSENPGVLEADPADTGSSLSAKLRRAWDYLSGNY
jgi:hypothetical protein